MSIRLIRSKVKAERVEDLEVGIQYLVPALEKAQLNDLRYEWYRLADGVTYVVLLEYAGEGDNPVNDLPEYQSFIELLKVSVTEPPVIEELTRSASYRSF